MRVNRYHRFIVLVFQEFSLKLVASWHILQRFASSLVKLQLTELVSYLVSWFFHFLWGCQLLNLFKVYENYNLLREFEPAKKIFFFKDLVNQRWSAFWVRLPSIVQLSVEVMYNYEHNLLLELLGDGIHFWWAFIFEGNKCASVL